MLEFIVVYHTSLRLRLLAAQLPVVCQQTPRTEGSTILPLSLPSSQAENIILNHTRSLLWILHSFNISISTPLSSVQPFRAITTVTATTRSQTSSVIPTIKPYVDDSMQHLRFIVTNFPTLILFLFINNTLAFPILKAPSISTTSTSLFNRYGTPSNMHTKPSPSPTSRVTTIRTPYWPISGMHYKLTKHDHAKNSESFEVAAHGIWPPEVKTKKNTRPKVSKAYQDLIDRIARRKYLSVIFNCYRRRR
ncbi:hypothetical protein BJ508DRAFT_20115 [Ascobolus immersus RN42]|uniref:Uncharacterized protein n=1 Tax=Ascobolus immersus RN42 TaxID=1160509 RepID=A0A3N4ITH7_ASCIM|nr:hypothetical protein BJ508DRAFT_20115 [Ascobolus immersus RN42]